MFTFRSQSILAALASLTVLAFSPADPSAPPRTATDSPAPPRGAGRAARTAAPLMRLQPTLDPFGDLVEVLVDDQCDGRIGDRVWHDANRNGLQDEGEKGLPGVGLVLYTADGQRIGTTATDERGMYLFGGLCAGSYFVRVATSTLPPGFVATPCNVGIDDTLDNDCSPAPAELIRDDARDLTVDFGFQCNRTPPEQGDEGCTPGYWKQSHHFDSWPADLHPDMLFSAIFADAFPGKTLVEVLGLNGGGLDALGRHAVAALLNACSPNVDYGMTVPQVIAAFNAAAAGDAADIENTKNGFEYLNQKGCPLN